MKRFRMISISTLLALVFSAMPLSARAATISRVRPELITNDVATTITITGSGFLVGSAVVL